MQLKDFLLSILGGGVALGPLLYMGLERVPQFGALDAALKRWVVALLAGLLGVAAWGAALFLGYVPTPSVFTPQFVAESLWTYGVLTGLTTFTSATLIHGHVALTKLRADVILD